SRLLLHLCEAIYPFALFRASAPKHNFCCLKNDGKIQQQRQVLYVKEVKLELCFGLFKSCTVLVLHLGPSGQSGPHSVALVEERNLLLQQFAEIRNFRSRTNQAHLSAKNVDELWQFVQTKLPQQTSQLRDPRVTIRCPTRPALLRTLPHRPEFQNLEGAPSQTNPLLAEQNRSSAFQKNADGDQQHHRKHESNQDGRNCYINGAFSCEQES